MSRENVSSLHAANEDAVVVTAIGILSRRFQQRPVFATPDAVKDFLRLQAQGLDHEVFAVMFIDTQHRMLVYERIFRETLLQTSVYPREIVKRALEVGAAAVILHHNHPSGVCTPSKCDEALTQTLKAALSLIDVRVFDHVITSDDGALSMAESGLL